MAGYLSPAYRWEVALSQIGKSGKDRNMKFFNSLSEEDQKEILASVADNLLDAFINNYADEGEEALEEEIFQMCSITSFTDLFEEYQKEAGNDN
jgi:TRAP-type C4-dicarboxylate transport system substrate-binding protein